MFTVTDYTVFIFMLLLSTLIGIYFGYIKKQQKTTNAYLLGGKQMHPIPVVISLVASNVSGVTLLAVPTDVYLYGGNYFFVCIPIVAMGILTYYLFLPVLLKLDVPNGYEYFNRRFNKTVRLLASFLFILQVLATNPIMAYIPALAFSQATGIQPYLITPVVCAICIFYTTIGGLKAVVWTDVFQFFLMILSLVTILALGAASMGGIKTVMQDVKAGERLDFDFSFDPTVREGFWAITVGGSSLWLNFISFHPGTIQKYLSVSNPTHAKWLSVAMSLGALIFTIPSTLMGLVLYSKYKGCDPLSAGEVQKNDQILPYFVENLAHDIPGLMGIFVAGIFSGALSTLSSSFNTMAAAIYGDFIKSYTSDISQKSANYILRVIVVTSGVLCILLALVVEKMGTILSFATAMQSCLGGLFVGLFSLGMLFPMANSTGALCGTIFSAFISFWITSANHVYKLRGVFDNNIKPLSVDNCDAEFNLTQITSTVDVDTPFVLYRLSHWYNGVIATVILVTVGLIVSSLTRADTEYVDPDLISPITIFLINRKKSKSAKNYEYDLANQKVNMIIESEEQ
ncbi:hypothetical protein FQA39_LY01691 [Lamprigera yunnana]|nr:hypothetical protein FQA39_LY01691 [Lamprigera yunnana]